MVVVVVSLDPECGSAWARVGDEEIVARGDEGWKPFPEGDLRGVDGPEVLDFGVLV